MSDLDNALGTAVGLGIGLVVADRLLSKSRTRTVYVRKKSGLAKTHHVYHRKMVHPRLSNLFSTRRKGFY